MKRIIHIFLIGIFILSACDDDDTIKTAPEIPPMETMVVDFGKLGNEVNKSALPEKTNWLYSATTVGVWNLIIGSTFAVPVSAFYHVAKEEPVLIQDLTWQWEYPFNAFAGQFKARLIGKLESANKIKWEMYISKTDNNPFDEFLWFEGTSNTNGKEGQWILYHSVASPVATVQIDWKKENDQVGEVLYTYVREKNEQRLADPMYGSTLRYGLQEAELDAFVEVKMNDKQSNSTNETTIMWSRTDYHGKVKAVHFFGDEVWHCWDKQGNDVECN